MKLINKLFTLALCLMITLLCSCSKEEDNVARAVLSSTSSLNFPAQKPTEKMMYILMLNGSWKSFLNGLQ